jgi:predicted ATP-grasp superfamily ATP-dependent carboligase
MADTLVVAGLWARPLAESAREAGWRIVAMDLFGDADTRRASVQWFGIGDPDSFTITPALLRDALQQAACEPGVLGWVAGSGFEGMPEALDMRIPGLPLLGTSAAAVRRLRDPAAFFRTLARLGLDHPEISLHAPRNAHGWLLKDAAGSGGWHIRRAADRNPPRGAAPYWQRVQPGPSMSALFLADGRRARLVALNRLVVRPLGALPHVYHGAVGPIRDGRLERRIQDALERLVPAFELRGLASLDFIAQGDRAWLLEINARPSATMDLYRHAWPGGLIRAHVRAVQGELPDAPASHPPGVRGSLIVYADGPCRAGAALAAELARSPDCHDLPAAGTCFAAGQPVCTVSTTAGRADAALVHLELRARRIRRGLTPVEELVA